MAPLEEISPARGDHAGNAELGSSCLAEDLAHTGPVPAGASLMRSSLPFRLVSAVIITGVAAGFSGMLLALLLHAVQHIAYGYDLARHAPPESFLQGVAAAQPIRRIWSLSVCGGIAGLGWYLVFSSRQKLVSVKRAVGSAVPGPPMPARLTIAHALLQIVTVGLGSPLGREVAPREMGALLAERIGKLMHLDGQDIRLIGACGAGGGLAAVYNVPLGGALFVLEVLLNSFSSKAVAMALGTCVIASTVAWLGLGDSVQYVVPPMAITGPLVLWAGLTGPLFGGFAFLFRKATEACVAASAQGWKRIVWCIAIFFCIGLVATRFPQLPGNGRGPIQLAFDGQVGVLLAAELLLLKLAGVMGSLRAGASGGLLTPGMTIGTLIALLLGAAWNNVAPPQLWEAYAIVGAAAFLASSMRMPLTAIMLALEFTRVDHDCLVPIALAVAGSVATSRLCDHRCRTAPVTAS